MDNIYLNNGPLCQNHLLYDGGVSVCGGSVGVGTMFCILQYPELNTASHINKSVQEIRRLMIGNGKVS